MLDLSYLFKHINFPSSPEDLSQAQRLFHGRGHGYHDLNHITIDWFSPILLIILFSPEEKSVIEQLASQLRNKLPDCQSIQVQYRYQLSAPIDVIYGEKIQDIIAQERQLKFYLSLGRVRNTGLFLDMSRGRQWIQNYSKNKRVLNLFSYTCGFSVAAIAGGAESVMNVDMSSPALSKGRENHRLNEQILNRVSFEKLNIFKSFSRLKKRGKFDLLICDPPTFQRGSVDIEKDYPKILRRLDTFMAEKSILMLCLNAPQLNRDFLLQHMNELASSYQLFDEVKPPDVFLEAEGKGLTILCFKR